MRAILFDLDGTLVDPAVGIIGCLRQTLRALGRTPPAAETLGWVIGPPLRHTLLELLGDAAEVDEAVRLYRERYAAEGLTHAHAYDGILEMLTQLAATTPLFVCTAKLEPFAERVVAHFGLAGPFTQVYGAAADGRFEDKADLVRHILDEQALEPAEACLVGDRRHDVAAARANGLTAVGVLWGYGSRGELLEAGAHVLCGTPAQLPAAIAAELSFTAGARPQRVI